MSSSNQFPWLLSPLIFPHISETLNSFSMRRRGRRKWLCLRRAGWEQAAPLLPSGQREGVCPWHPVERHGYKPWLEQSLLPGCNPSHWLHAFNTQSSNLIVQGEGTCNSTKIPWSLCRSRNTKVENLLLLCFFWIIPGPTNRFGKCIRNRYSGWNFTCQLPWSSTNLSFCLLLTLLPG